MKKNGFTLIELIVTIALLGLAGVVLSMNMIKLINSQQSDKKEEFKKLLEETACAYVGLSSVTNCDTGCTLTGAELITAGMIDEEINGYKVEEYNVTVTYDNGEKKCIMEDI